MSEDAGDRRLGHGQLLGLAVRRRREALNLTQEHLAELIGGEVDANYVTHLETGRRMRLPEQPLLGQLATALRCRQVDLLVDAGVITEPLPVEGAPRALYPPGSQQARIAALLADVPDRTLEGLEQYVRFLSGHPIPGAAEPTSAARS